MKTLPNRLIDLLQRYEELAATSLLDGAPPDPAVVCAGDPDLLPAFLEALRQLDRFRQNFDPDTHNISTVPVDGATDPVARPVLLALPGYELEAKLGEGGMGIVYRAIQRRGRRTVAIKMIRSGARAPTSSLRRFQTEIEAVARLQHPNIVQVFEIGEHNGLPFFSMEFCAGGSLAQRLVLETIESREAAALVHTLALAIQAAHDARVLHRDLKPGNVLLAADGTPKISDFGLAKKLDEEGQTRTGEVMGTPSYMPPEQARGDADLGPAADIYALGAILYHCLTGRPPFRAASSLETLLQVVSSEPAGVRQLNPSVPRDLETICQKCLAKEPGRRYASARALADDLGQFVEGRPIAARPVGAVERGWRWCRRNPALALALTAALVFLVGGSVTATWFGLVASQRATDLEGKVEELQGALAKKDLVVLALQPGPLSDQERESFAGVAEQRGQWLAWRFLREAMTDPKMRKRLPIRAEYIWQAALGLDRQQRAEAERYLLAELRGDPSATPLTELALAAAALGDLSPEGAAAVVASLKHTLALPTSPESKRLFALGLPAVAAVAAHLEPEKAAEIATTLARTLGQTADLLTVITLAQGLAGAVANVEPPAAAEVATLVLAAMNRSTDRFALGPLRTALAAAVGRMRPAPAARLLSEGIGRTPNPLAIPLLAKVLTAALPRLNPGELADLVLDLTRMLTEAKSFPALDALAEVLRGAIARLDDRAVGPVCGRAVALLVPTLSANPLAPRDPRALAARTNALRYAVLRAEPVEIGPTSLLLEVISKNVEPRYVPARWRLISGIAARLDARRAAAVADRLVQVMSKTTSSGERARLARSLSSVLRQMARPEAARMGGQAATLLRQAMSKQAGPGQADLAEGWSLLVGWPEPKAGTVTALVEAMTRTTDSGVLYHLTQGLTFIADQLKPNEAAPAAAALLPAVRPGMEQRALEQLTRGLNSLTARLDAKEATAVADRLAEVTNNTTDPRALATLAAALLVAADRLPPGEAARRCRPVADLLAQKMKATTEPATLASLGRILAGVVGKLPPAEAAGVCGPPAALLARTLIRTNNPGVAWDLAACLPEMIGRLPPAEIATLLVELLEKIKDASALKALASILSAVSPRLEPKEAAKLVAVLFQARSQTTDRFAIVELERCLALVTPRLDAREASAVVTRLTGMMNDTQTPYGLEPLAQALVGVLGRLPPGDAAPLLTRAMNKNNALAMRALAESLGGVVAPLGRAEATRVCGPAVALLARAMSDVLAGGASGPIQTRDLESLAQGLASLAVRLEPEESSRVCHQAATVLLQAVSNTREGGFDSLTRGLGAVVALLEPRAAAALLLRATRQMTNAYGLLCLARELAREVGRLEPKEAAQVCAAAADRFLQAINDMTTSGGLEFLTQGLTALAMRLERREAARVCARAAGVLTLALRKKDRNEADQLTRTLTLLAAWMDPAEGSVLLIETLSQAGPDHALTLTQELTAILESPEDHPVPIRRAAVAGTVAGLTDPWTLLAAPVQVQPALAPPAPPLRAQTLVDLLKHPLCVGAARRIVLAALSRRYGRPFADQWEFARFAEEQNLGLDLLGPAGPSR